MKTDRIVLDIFAQIVKYILNFDPGTKKKRESVIEKIVDEKQETKECPTIDEANDKDNCPCDALAMNNRGCAVSIQASQPRNIGSHSHGGMIDDATDSTSNSNTNSKSVTL